MGLVPNGAETCAFCITLASQGWMPASRAQLNGSYAEHIHANCMCEFAICFDGETEIDGYEPDKYYDMYMNVSDDNDSVKKINAMRRELYEDKKKIKYKGGLSLHGNNANGSLKLDIQLFAEKDIKIKNLLL